MVFKWKMNDAIEIELLEPTLEALEKLLSDSGFSIFTDEESKEIIRAKFKKDVLKNGK
jgi:uncharacterized protein (DUF302 family)